MFDHPSNTACPRFASRGDPFWVRIDSAPLRLACDRTGSALRDRSGAVEDAYLGVLAATDQPACVP